MVICWLGFSVYSGREILCICAGFAKSADAILVFINPKRHSNAQIKLFQCPLLLLLLCCFPSLFIFHQCKTTNSHFYLLFRSMQTPNACVCWILFFSFDICLACAIEKKHRSILVWNVFTTLLFLYSLVFSSLILLVPMCTTILCTTAMLRGAIGRCK